MEEENTSIVIILYHPFGFDKFENCNKLGEEGDHSTSA